jgi:hypothetical protein
VRGEVEAARLTTRDGEGTLDVDRSILICFNFATPSSPSFKVPRAAEGNSSDDPARTARRPFRTSGAVAGGHLHLTFRRTSHLQQLIKAQSCGIVVRQVHGCRR